MSTASVLTFAYLLVAVAFDFDWAAIVVRHIVPVMIMNYWLVMVTYLQHHEADTNVRLVRGREGKRECSEIHGAVEGKFWWELFVRCVGWLCLDVYGIRFIAVLRLMFGA